MHKQNYSHIYILILTLIHDFIQVSKNLTRYRSKNNFIGLSK